MHAWLSLLDWFYLLVLELGSFALITAQVKFSSSCTTSKYDLVFIMTTERHLCSITRLEINIDQVVLFEWLLGSLYWECVILKHQLFCRWSRERPVSLGRSLLMFWLLQSYSGGDSSLHLRQCACVWYRFGLIGTFFQGEIISLCVFVCMLGVNQYDLVLFVESFRTVCTFRILLGYTVFNSPILQTAMIRIRMAGLQQCGLKMGVLTLWVGESKAGRIQKAISISESFAPAKY